MNGVVALALKGIRKTFHAGSDALPVLNGIDVQVRAGEVVAVLGPSGCGKSTLLRIAAGLESADEGQLLFTAGPDQRRGLMFQEPRLLPWLTVEDNVLFPVTRRPPPAIVERARALLALVGLTGFARAHPHQLSGGMAQRVALARALLLQPSILLMDEPFGALDWMTKVRLQGQLQQLPDFARAATLLVTHDIEEAVFLASRVVVLSERPARVAAVIDIDTELPAPRDRAGDAFNRLRRAVYDACFGARVTPRAAAVIAKPAAQSGP